MIKNVEGIFKNCLYINLEHRIDRKEHIEKEFTEKLKISVPERFQAIYNEHGIIGCGLSHLECLKIAKQRNWEYVVIVEDDIFFLDIEVFKKSFNSFLKSNINFDVLLFAGNNYTPFDVINDYCVKVYNCQTATGYIVKQTYYDTMIEHMQQGIECLMKEPHNHHYYANDQWWKHLQKKDNWYLLTPLTVIQREGYSDNAGAIMNYENSMLTLDKN